MANQITVTIKNMEFSPDPAEIKKGDSIVWHNQDNMTHTASADDKSWDTGNIPKGGKSKPITFNNPGSSPYHCKIHPSMTATVSVS